MGLLKTSLAIILLCKYQIKAQGDESETFSCGKRLVNHEALILNGQTSKEGDWPWHTGILHIQSNLNIEYKCGGTLINSQSVLTAAHCVYENSRPIVPDRVLIQLGRQNLKISATHSQDIEIFQIFPHHNFNESSLANDIAIVRLATRATFNNYVQPICLWESNKKDLSEVVGKFGTVVGFGITETDQISYTLRQAVIPVVDLTTCLESDRNFFGNFLSDSTFCAGYRNGTNACNGDSGGSLSFIENDLYRIRGIVSLTQARPENHSRLCKTDQYVVFTDVAKYLQWIREIVPGLPSEESSTRNQSVSSNEVEYCYFLNNDLKDVRIPQDECKDRCASTPRCTHFTWTDYEDGTCWMKQNRVTEKDARPSVDRAAVCGIVENFSHIAWNESNLAFGCDFWENDLKDFKTDDHRECYYRCIVTEDCTHFGWDHHDGGTCWMKENPVSRSDAFVTADKSTACGIVKTIDWNGNNWALGCDFPGFDLVDIGASSDDCRKYCAANPLCTHYTWNGESSGTCYIKQYNGVTKNDAVATLDPAHMCGIK